MKNLTLPNLLSVARLFMAPIAFYLIIDEAWVPMAILLWLAIASDIADGYLARSWNQSSALGGLLDHASDAVLVTTMLAAEVYLGMVPVILPILVMGAFIQYTLDSDALSGQTLRASKLGRYNGILYFVLAGFPIMQHALSIYLLPDAALMIFAYLLIISTLISMAERLFTLIQLKR